MLSLYVVPSAYFLLAGTFFLFAGITFSSVADRVLTHRCLYLLALRSPLSFFLGGFLFRRFGSAFELGVGRTALFTFALHPFSRTGFYPGSLLRDVPIERHKKPQVNLEIKLT